ncbi:hypothetical protein Cha6605_5623 [Chamaesiphon minutus PCC 6605]|uniref:Uncharacterized protein n=2 Tax=Chamaesiphon TaxID=217161 RepID=K9UQI1_CHAP6|nr:hypothetical protein Cha6605_5623 [Chamaesiphon minutus PCC 6605]
MAQVITSTRMLNLRKVCWGMLGVIAIGAFEPVVWAAIPEIEPVVSFRSNLLAADPSFADILKGNSIPTSIKLRELTPEWRAMSTNGQLEIGNFQAFVSLFGGGAFANNYYTKGQTVTIGSETYIVAYSILSLAERVAPDLTLNLSLLNLKTIGSMSNIRAFDTIAETKVLEKQLASLQITNLFGGNKTEEKPVEAPVVQPAEVKPPTTVRKKRRTIRKPRRRQIRRTINRNN